MGPFEILELLCGLSLFLYGMDVMGDSLKKSAGSQLRATLGKMTSNNFKGFLLGLIVTAIIQSSSATTVMVVGFVNSGVMTLSQCVGVIMGANLGTAVTAWLTGLSGLGAAGEAASSAIKWLKPDAWMPVLAVIGICFLMFSKSSKKKNVGTILLGFAVLMVGMDLMSGSVSGLKNDPGFRQILTMFSNPILGVLAGLVLTAIVQSSSASVGILQSLTATGAITYGAAIPIVMGQNIGTCVTAMISSVSANKNGKRAALIHLYFNIIGVVVVLAGYSVLDYFFNFAFADGIIGMWGVAGVHTIFKIISIILLAPFSKGLERLAVKTIPDKKDEEEIEVQPLDERLMDTPSVAVEQAKDVTKTMAHLSCDALRKAIASLSEYDQKTAEKIREKEGKVDIYEDTLGTYLVKLSSREVDESDSREITMLLHLIGDFERISDHSVNILESAEEIKEKGIEFSEQAKKELASLLGAVDEIVSLTEKAFLEGDLEIAARIEPLEQVVDYLRDKIKLNHIIRLQKSQCSIEHGFVLSDLLTSCERVSDHCSNIGGCILELSTHHALDMHKFLRSVKKGGESFDRLYGEFKKKYEIQ